MATQEVLQVTTYSHTDLIVSVNEGVITIQNTQTDATFAAFQIAYADWQDIVQFVQEKIAS